LENKEVFCLLKIPDNLKKPKTIWIGVALFIGLLLINVDRFYPEPATKEAIPAPISPGDRETVPGVATDLATAEVLIEQRLEKILSAIEGAGNVKVTVFLAAGPKYKYAFNTTSNQRSIEEKDREGGTRVTMENNQTKQLVLFRGIQAGREEPVVTKEIKPDVQGVLVVATGAHEPRVKAKISRAVETALHIELYKVNVLPGGERR
jgi:stage III sporulation protein AG